MKPGALLVNAGRGRVVDKAALIEALTDQRSWRFVGEQVGRLRAGLPLENWIAGPGDPVRAEAG